MDRQHDLDVNGESLSHRGGSRLWRKLRWRALLVIVEPPGKIVIAVLTATEAGGFHPQLQAQHERHTDALVQGRKMPLIRNPCRRSSQSTPWRSDRRSGKLFIRPSTARTATSHCKCSRTSASRCSSGCNDVRHIVVVRRWQPPSHSRATRRLLIADRPNNRINMTTQAQVLHLLQDLQQQRDAAIIFITRGWVCNPQMAAT